jgi:hypothetical protein
VIWNSSVPPVAIALDLPTVYFATTGISLLSCGPSVCAPIVVGGTPTAIDVSATSVYVGTQAAGSPGAVASCPEADCPGGTEPSSRAACRTARGSPSTLRMSISRTGG